MSVEEVKAALRALAEREPSFLLDILAGLEGELVERLFARPETVGRLLKAADPEAAAELLRKAAERPDAVAELLRAAAASPEAARAFVQLLLRPEVAAVVASTPIIEALAEAVGRSPEVAARLAAAVAGHIAIPLNVATKEDLKALEAKMATSEDVKALADRVAAVEAAVADVKAKMVTREELEEVGKNLVTKEEFREGIDRVVTILRHIQHNLGIRFEHYTAAWLERWLGERGVRCAVEVGKRLEVDGETEVDVFCQDPLVVGEVTVILDTVDEAEKELEKLLRKAQDASRRLGRPLYAAVLAVEWTPSQVAKWLEEACRQRGVVLVLGRSPR